jgi:cyclopropane-fatty-acyl-phospholipid synthase
MSSLFRSALDAVQSYAGSAAWDPLVRVSRTGVLSLLQQMTIGQLLVVDKDDAKTLCGQSTVADLSTEPTTELRVRNDAFWVRLALFADMVSSRQLWL